MLFAVGGVVAGVASTVFGSWINSRIHIYQESRKAHLEDIKQKVLLPLKEILSDKYAALVKHEASAVVVQWGIRKRLEGVSVIAHQTEEGPSLVPVLPDISSVVDSTLYADVKKKHFAKLATAVEVFDEAWVAHANKCYAWVSRVSEDIIAKSRLGLSSGKYGESYVDSQKLGLFIYRRLLPVGQHSLVKHSREHPPVRWVLEGFEGTSAEGTERELSKLVEVLDTVMVAERTVADGIIVEAQGLARKLAELMSEIDYAIAYRRLRKKCHLVPFL